MSAVTGAIPGLEPLLLSGTAFVASHIGMSSTRWRGALRDQLGENGFLALYSVTSLATLAWFVLAYRHAPWIPLWGMHRWMVLVPLIAMPLATILLLSGYSTRNPTAVGMERQARADDPAPGILRVTRHPILWAIGIWATAHIPPNGDLASILFFGALAGLALGGTILIDRKKRLALGSDWARLAQVTSNIPFAALIGRRTGLRTQEIGWLRIIAGLLLYAVLYGAHPLIAGMPVASP